ncbi:MAG: hypothetical protein SGPRY_004257 [Prymnesium sp.]
MKQLHLFLPSVYNLIRKWQIVGLHGLQHRDCRCKCAIEGGALRDDNTAAVAQKERNNLRIVFLIERRAELDEDMQLTLLSVDVTTGDGCPHEALRVEAPARRQRDERAEHHLTRNRLTAGVQLEHRPFGATKDIRRAHGEQAHIWEDTHVTCVEPAAAECLQPLTHLGEAILAQQANIAPVHAHTQSMRERTRL